MSNFSWSDCAACRLRSLIVWKVTSRTRKMYVTDARSIVSRRSSTVSIQFCQSRQRTSPAVVTPALWITRPARAGILQTLPSMQIHPSRNISTSSRRLARRRPGSAQYAPRVLNDRSTKVVSIQFFEQLYRSEHISRHEWRESVFNMAARGEEELEIDIEGRLKDLLQDVRLRVAALKTYFGGNVENVPEGFLEDEERLVWDEVVVDTNTAIDFEAESVQETVEPNYLRQELNEKPITREETEGLDERDMPRGNIALAEDIEAAINQAHATDESFNSEQDAEEADVVQRVHPMTLANRFTTFPSTLELPGMALVDPVASMLSGISNTHLSDAAHRTFGGPGLPYSTSTPARGKLMQQRPVALNAAQPSMSEIEGDIYMAAILPGIYASVMSTLTETRKRLGTTWAESLVRKADAGTLRILDAGAGGAGVLAVRDMLHAEWERMHEGSEQSTTGLVAAGGKTGGAGAYPPLGVATVLTGSDVIRRRASALLENTTFVPRLPDYAHTEVQKTKGKFDIVIAPHSIWPLQEDYLRKAHVQNLWSLTSADGGLLLLLEKGVARGFELVAGARDMLLDSVIAPQDSNMTLHQAMDASGQRAASAKEPGAIIAPCTNHSSCPMYIPKGVARGRRDICAFPQRYHRPAFLQNIFGTKGRNHEDVEFSYLSVMRGRTLRDIAPRHQRLVQDSVTTDRAFAGYESSTPQQEHVSLTLPRLILPPLKRHGHAILDVCTPEARLERWTVPRSFSKQAYRDARKAQWGDLWALGAKTRVPRTPKVKRPSYLDEQQPVAELGEETVGVDEYGRLTIVRAGERGAVTGVGGRLRAGKKVKGIRSKRDKKAGGNGRRKSQMEE